MPRIRKDKMARSYAEPFWKIGLYIRLSREDDNEDESESVINQEKILRDFVDSYFEPGTYVIVDVFADDGLTGTDTARPNFKRFEGCIVRKEVNCMIIKSLARGFRNLADQQKFWRSSYPFTAQGLFAQARHLLTLTLTPILQAVLKYLLGECSMSSLPRPLPKKSAKHSR